MANLVGRFLETTKNPNDTSPASAPAISSSHGRSFTVMKLFKVEDPSLIPSFGRRIDSAVSVTDICLSASSPEISPRSSFQAYAQNRMKITMAERPHHKRNHAISASRPSFIEHAERLRHPTCNNHRNPKPLQDPEEYNTIHLGPHITVSSADGTTICPELHNDDEMNNMAAFQLYRAFKAQIEQNRQFFLDRHPDTIIGAINIEVQQRSVTARRSVHIMEGPDFEPQQGLFEGIDEGVAQGQKDILRRVSAKIKRRVLGRRDRSSKRVSWGREGESINHCRRPVFLSSDL